MVCVGGGQLLVALGPLLSSSTDSIVAVVNYILIVFWGTCCWSLGRKVRAFPLTLVDALGPAGADKLVGKVKHGGGWILRRQVRTKRCWRQRQGWIRTQSGGGWTDLEVVRFCVTEMFKRRTLERGEAKQCTNQPTWSSWCHPARNGYIHSPV